jgi:CBS domain-containing protein
VWQAAVSMGELDVGGLPVGTAEHAEGVLTDRDILYRVVARGLDPASVRVDEVMSRPLVACRPDDTLHAAMDLMAGNHIRRLAVQDEGGTVVGWLTLSDLSRHLLLAEGPVKACLQALTESPEAPEEEGEDQPAAG